ncbi:hypothetical protein M2326_002485 [Flavobacterium sp. 7A]|nr:hypothetical protein [Flavobacterium sp. 7A]
MHKSQQISNECFDRKFDTSNFVPLYFKFIVMKNVTLKIDQRSKAGNAFLLMAVTSLK